MEVISGHTRARNRESGYCRGKLFSCVLTFSGKDCSQPWPLSLCWCLARKTLLIECQWIPEKINSEKTELPVLLQLLLLGSCSLRLELHWQGFICLEKLRQSATHMFTIESNLCFETTAFLPVWHWFLSLCFSKLDRNTCLYLSALRQI